MNRLVGFSSYLAVLFIVGFASAQSLSEVAKKEKERRAQNQTEAGHKVIGENELANAEGDGLSITGEESTQQSTAPRRSIPTTTSRPTRTEGGSTGRNVGVRPLEPDVYRGKRPSQAQRERNKQMYEAAVATLESLKQTAKDCAYAKRHSQLYTTVGCEGIEDKVKRAERRVKEFNKYR